MTIAEKQDQQQRMGNINSLAMNLFMSECTRVGIPTNEEEALKLIERCFTTAQVMTDYLRDKIEPFI